MPVLKQHEENVQRIYLPSTKHLPEAEQAFVDMDVRPLQTGSLEQMSAEGSMLSFNLEIVTSRIKGWNFTDENGADLPVAIETVKLLDVEDFNALKDSIETVGGVTEAEKKA